MVCSPFLCLTYSDRVLLHQPRRASFPNISITVHWRECQALGEWVGVWYGLAKAGLSSPLRPWRGAEPCGGANSWRTPKRRAELRTITGIPPFRSIAVRVTCLNYACLLRKSIISYLTLDSPLPVCYKRAFDAGRRRAGETRRLWSGGARPTSHRAYLITHLRPQPGGWVLYR